MSMPSSIYLHRYTITHKDYGETLDTEVRLAWSWDNGKCRAEVSCPEELYPGESFDSALARKRAIAGDRLQVERGHDIHRTIDINPRGET